MACLSDIAPGHLTEVPPTRLRSGLHPLILSELKELGQ